MSNGQARTASPPSHRAVLTPRPASIEGREYNNWGQSVKESAAMGAFSPGSTPNRAPMAALLPVSISSSSGSKCVGLRHAIKRWRRSSRFRYGNPSSDSKGAPHARTRPRQPAPHGGLPPGVLYQEHHQGAQYRGG